MLRNEQERAAAAPEVIAHHFTEAGLDDLAIEWWGRAGDQALRRSAFQEAIAHLGKAIAMADAVAGGKATGEFGQRLHLHVAYGNALMAGRGPGGGRETCILPCQRLRLTVKRKRRNGWLCRSGYGEAATSEESWRR